MTREERRVGAVVSAVGLLLLVVLAALLVPWDPVAGPRLEPVDPSALLTEEQVDRAERFSSTARLWSLGSLAVSLVVACWFAFSRRGAAVLARLRGSWWWRVLSSVAVLVLAGRLVTAPFAVLQHQHFRASGLSRQGWASYAADVAKGEALQVVTTTLALVAVMACARRWQRAWPAVAGGLVAALVLLGSFVYPLVVEPLFSSFTPLPDGELRTQVLALAEEEGVAVDEVLVSDASRRTTTINAYVSGFGSTRRVVLYDTLVDDLPRDEALSVVAHELAHARHDDVLLGSTLGAVGAGTGVGLLAVVLGVLGRRARSLRDPAVVPVVLAVFAVGSLLASPVENLVSRRIETRADVDALRATGDPDGFVALQRHLAARSLADPTPPRLLHLWFGSHPTATTRTALAERMAGD